MAELEGIDLFLKLHKLDKSLSGMTLSKCYYVDPTLLQALCAQHTLKSA